MEEDTRDRQEAPIEDIDVAALTSTYKVLGELTDSSGTGVVGRNLAGSGANYGVAGATESRNTNAAGVYAEALAGSANGVTAKAENGGTGVEATTDAIGNYGVWGVNLSTAGARSFGVRGETFSTDTNAAGVLGNTRAGGGVAQLYGVIGESDASGSGSTTPAGMFGIAQQSGSAGPTFGVHGVTRSDSFEAAGVRADAPRGNAIGVRATGLYGLYVPSARRYAVHTDTGALYGAWHRTTETGATAVFGQAVQSSTTSSTQEGGFLTSAAPNSIGCYAAATGSTGNGVGVYGTTPQASGTGVEGRATNGGNGLTYGVYGTTNSESTDAAGVRGVQSASSGLGYGVRGEGYGAGVRGDASRAGAKGVVGRNDAGGDDNSSTGVYGETNSSLGTGVWGYASATSGSPEGVYGRSLSETGDGVYGSAPTTSTGKAVYAAGNLFASGDLEANGAKSFVERMPADDAATFGVETPDPAPEENRTAEETEIRYNSIEAPKVHTEITGTERLSGGSATVELPTHFAAVTSDAEGVDVQVTPHSTATGGLAVSERSERSITVEDVGGSGDYEFTYTVTGVRRGYEDRRVVRPAEDRPDEGDRRSPPDLGDVPAEREPKPGSEPPEPPEESSEV